MVLIMNDVTFIVATIIIDVMISVAVVEMMLVLAMAIDVLLDHLLFMTMVLF